jgi:hypothetical protein
MIEQAAGTTGDRRARPLGVRPDVPLTDAQWTALQRLQDYDLAPVRARLLKTGVLPAERVDEAIFEFRRFLALSIVGYDELPMVSAAVDEVWHTSLLYSRLYADLCRQTVGHFAHHEPTDPHDAGAGDTRGSANGPDCLRTFQQAYTRVYGEMPWWMQLGQQEDAHGEGDGLTEADLAGVAGSGSKPGVSPGIGVCKVKP